MMRGHDFFSGAVFEDHGEHWSEVCLFGTVFDVAIDASGQVPDEVFHFGEFIGSGFG